jgi:hypothetical protein
MVRGTHEVPHLAKITTPGQSVEQRIATLLAAPGLAASPLRARAHGMLLHVGKVVCRLQQPHMQGLPRSSQRQACPAPGCSAPPCYASLICERQQARAEARGSRAAKPCVRSEMGCCRTIARVSCVAACSTACCISQQCCAYLARPAAAVSNRALCAGQAREAVVRAEEP